MLFAVLAVPAMANISGAIFTTESLCDGTNENLFDYKEDVYLDGGPRKEGSAGLPDGYYYVQVTSPNGLLLGITPTASVQVTNSSFAQCYQLWDILVKASDGTQGYDDTPNNGGVYKAWVTPEEKFKPGDGTNGFINAWCKTDNFKVKNGGNGDCPEPSVISVHKFRDSNANGLQDPNEEELDWLVDVTDPDLITQQILTPFTVLPTLTGTWRICEVPQSGWLQTALVIDGVAQEPNDVMHCVDILVASTCQETHAIAYGNIELGSITACKFIDLDLNGYNGAEPPLAGIRMTLKGTDILGKSVDLMETTGDDGCVTFGSLLPGSYELCEEVPLNWLPTTDQCVAIELAEGQTVLSEFGNVCVGYAAFGTKGYWHNKNGLDETKQADIDYINTLAPWLACNSSTKPFGAINGFYCDGKKVPAAKVGKTTIAPAGSAKAEQSIFLVYKNSVVKLQLAQQLYAYILNVRNRLTDCGPDSMILLPDGTWASAQTLIDKALTVWSAGTVALNDKVYDRSKMSNLLDKLNNSTVTYVNCELCPVEYPELPIE